LKSVMLTGATGFIGSHVARMLLRRGISTNLFVRRETGDTELLRNRGAKVYLGTPEDDGTLRVSLAEVDTVVHCAGATAAFREKDYIRANVDFTDRILRTIREGQRFVHLSSQAAAGPAGSSAALDEDAAPRPISAYGRSKLLAENAVRRWGRQNNNYVILRPSAVYGPGEKSLSRAFGGIRRGYCVLLGDGEQRVSLVHVSDLVEAVMAAAECPAGGGTYFVCNDEAYSWNEIIQCAAEVLGVARVRTVRIPRVLAYLAAGLMECAAVVEGKPTVLNRQKVRELRQLSWMCSNARIRNELGWRPRVSLKEGIATCDLP